MPFLGNTTTSFNVDGNNINNGAITSEKIAAGAVVNADVNDTASIAGTKISADFGAQDLIVDTNLLFVDVSEDRIGIGTSSPVGKLDIDGGSSAFTVQFKETSGAYHRMGIQKNNNLLSLGELNNDGDTFTSILSVSGNGDRVGIGTTSPGAKLEISANNAGAVQNNVLRFTDTDGSFQSGQSPGRIEFNTSDADSPGTTAFIDTHGYTNAVSDLLFGTGAGGSATERMRIKHDGMVGIGTSSPLQDLHVQGTTGVRIQNSTDTDGQFILTYTSNSPDFRMYDTSGNVQVKLLASGNSYINGGNVGIGTTSPSNLLHIAGTGTDVIGLRIVNTQHQNVVSTAGLKFGITNSAGQRNCRIQAREEAVDSNAISLDFFTSNADATDGETVKMTINNNGNVGIGTTSASNLLDIQGNTPRLEITDTAGTGNAARPGVIMRDSGATNLFFIGNGASADSDLTVRNYTSAGSTSLWTNNTERLRVDSSGRLLLGTTTEGHPNADDFTIAGSGNAGITIRSGSTSVGGIFFSDATTGSGEYDGYIEYNQNTRSMSFGVAAADAIRINTDGDVAIGLSSPGYQLDVSSDGVSHPALGIRQTNSSFAQSSFFINVNRTTTNSSYNFLRCLAISSDRCFIRDSGTIENATGTYQSISDIKLKENIVDAPSQWDDIKNIRIRNYNFKPETNYSTHKQIGIVAQELELVCPGLVDESPDQDVDGNDLGTTTKAVKSSILYMKAVKALQEAMERIETLEAEVAALKGA